MTAAPETRVRPAKAASPEGWPLPGLSLLLGLLGVLSLTGFTAGGSIPAGTGALDAADAAAVGDPALLRSTSRLLGFKAAQPFCKGQDSDDTAKPSSAVAVLPIPGWPDTANAELHPAPVEAARPRPLQGVPQSPRAPPHLT